MKNTKKNSDENKVLFWGIVMANRIEEYANIFRKYCLDECSWKDVEDSRDNAQAYGVSAAELNNIECAVMSSIMDEEIIEAVFGK